MGRSNPVASTGLPVDSRCAIESLPLRPSRVERAEHAQARLGHDVSVNHRRFDVLVREQFLVRAEIVTVFQQVRGERVPEGVTRQVFTDPRHVGCLLDAAVNSAGVGVPAHAPTRFAIRSDERGAEQKLPPEFPCGPWLFVFQAGRDGCISGTMLHVALVSQPDEFDLYFQALFLRRCRTLHAATYWSRSLMAFILLRKHCSVNSRSRIHRNSLKDWPDGPLTRDPWPLMMAVI